MSTLLAILAILATLFGGAYLVALMDGLWMQRAATGSVQALLGEPVRRTVHALRRQRITTEAPDAVGLWVAPALYPGLAVLALALVPVGPDQVLIDPPAAIVVWGAIESLVVVAVFLHGWSQNSLFPLIGGYRFVAIGLSAMLLSMFVLIGASLPAESLRLTSIVESQQDLWNVVRQPLGLPLFLLLGLAVSLREPMNFADSADLAGGTAVEDSGPVQAAWQFARMAMMVAFSAVAASAFLGGYLGPLLPGPVWLLLKTLALLALLVIISHTVFRPDVSRALTWLWTVLLPLAFVDLVIAGLGSLP